MGLGVGRRWLVGASGSVCMCLGYTLKWNPPRPKIPNWLLSYGNKVDSGIVVHVLHANYLGKEHMVFNCSSLLGFLFGEAGSDKISVGEPALRSIVYQAV